MSLICCFCCITCCGCRNYVCQKLVYFPPKPQYTIARTEDPATHQEVTAMFHQNDKGERSSPRQITANFKLEFLKTERAETIASLWITRPNARSTLLFSHGNATDIGAMRDHLLNMSEILKINIFTYDYSGYGMSSGKPSPANTLADAECAFKHLRDKLVPQVIAEQKAAAGAAGAGAGAQEKSAEADGKAGAAADAPPLFNGKHKIIVYGQSLGGAATCHLASTFPNDMNAVVIHSSFMSGLRVIRPVTTTHWFDIFPSVDRIKLVTAPLYIMHGTADKEIPIHHGIGLSENAKNMYPPWWVEGAGHNNIEIHWRDEYYTRLRTFVRAVEHEIIQQKIEDAKANLKAGKPALPPPVVTPASGNGNGNGHKRADDSDDEESANAKPVQMEKISAVVTRD